MDGVHDLGGMQGFGPVVPSGPDEPPFPERWEGRVHGMMLGVHLSGAVRGGTFRPAIEGMGAIAYLTTTYYEHWLHAVEAMLAETGALTASEVDAAEARVVAGEAPAVRSDPGTAEVVRSLFRPGPAREEETGGRFEIGDRVRVRNSFGPGHTRCPRYVRGRTGVVERVLPTSPVLDALAEGELRPEPCYTITFAARDLWADPGLDHTVAVDLWESHLA